MSSFMTGMEQRTIRANGVRINTWVGGEGEPVVLLHGYPQTAQMWRKVAPLLLNRFTVVCPDLRGYGDSDKPRDGYDKRSMAKDVTETMKALGFERFALVGHDRGARVAHRLAMDYPDAVKNLTVLDIVPTHTVFRDAGKDLAAAYWHWFFFQVPDLPEIMLARSAEPFLRSMFRALCFRQDAIEEPMFAEYLRAFMLPGTIRAGLEDYRCCGDGGHRRRRTRSGQETVLSRAGNLGRAGQNAYAVRRARHVEGEGDRCARPAAALRSFHTGRGAAGIGARVDPFPGPGPLNRRRSRRSMDQAVVESTDGLQ